MQQHQQSPVVILLGGHNLCQATLTSAESLHRFWVHAHHLAHQASQPETEHPGVHQRCDHFVARLLRFPHLLRWGWGDTVFLEAPWRRQGHKFLFTKRMSQSSGVYDFSYGCTILMLLELVNIVQILFHATLHIIKHIIIVVQALRARLAVAHRQRAAIVIFKPIKLLQAKTEMEYRDGRCRVAELPCARTLFIWRARPGLARGAPRGGLRAGRRGSFECPNLCLEFAHLCFIRQGLLLPLGHLAVEGCVRRGAPPAGMCMVLEGGVGGTLSPHAFSSACISICARHTSVTRQHPETPARDTAGRTGALSVFISSLCLRSLIFASFAAASTACGRPSMSARDRRTRAMGTFLASVMRALVSDLAISASFFVVCASICGQHRTSSRGAFRHPNS
jgi:hypothetical protein